MDKEEILQLYGNTLQFKPTPKASWTFADDTDTSYPLSPPPISVEGNTKETTSDHDSIGTPDILITKEKAKSPQMKPETKQKWNRWLQKEKSDENQIAGGWEIEELWVAPSLE